MTDVRELMGWTKCGRCTTPHWNDDWVEHPIDYMPTVEDLLWYLQREYGQAHLRWDDDNEWESDAYIPWEGQTIYVFASRSTPYLSLVNLIEKIKSHEAQHHSRT